MKSLVSLVGIVGSSLIVLLALTASTSLAAPTYVVEGTFEEINLQPLGVGLDLPISIGESFEISFEIDPTPITDAPFTSATIFALSGFSIQMGSFPELFPDATIQPGNNSHLIRTLFDPRPTIDGDFFPQGFDVLFSLAIPGTGTFGVVPAIAEEDLDLVDSFVVTSICLNSEGACQLAAQAVGRFSSVRVIPEPSTSLCLALGLAVLASRRTTPL